MLKVVCGGFSQWLDKPEPDREIEGRRLLGLIRAFTALAMATMARDACLAT